MDKGQIAGVWHRSERLPSARISVSETAGNLGSIVDSQLTLPAQVSTVCRSGYYQLQQLRLIVRSMSSDTVKTLVQAFISCRLDYCYPILSYILVSLA